MRVGVLTGGGDVPGLNAAIRAVVKRGEGAHGHSLVGFRNGWKGVVDGDVRPLTRQDIRNVLPTGGTLLGTSRYHPHRNPGGVEAVLATLVWSGALGRSALIATDLPELPSGKTYELWYIRDGQATAAGTMNATGGSDATWRVLTGRMAAGDTVGVTVEPRGGSKQPTTPPIVAIAS